MPERPRLRSDLEIFVAESEQGRLVMVRDPEIFAIDAAQFGVGVLPILGYLDGAHTLADIRGGLASEGAGFVPVEQLTSLLDVLDRCYFLDNERFRTETKARQEFLDAGIRPAAHAGAAYPAEAAPARDFLGSMLAQAKLPPAAPLRRIIAPHIDLQLGSEVYAHAHQRLAAAGRPDVVVVLGVRHDLGTRRFIACRKDFATPLGVVRHDPALMDALDAGLGTDLTQEQLVHRTEHSVEFQALWLAHLWPDDPPAIVPILVGSFHDHIESGGSPCDDDEIEAFIRTLRDAISKDARDIVVMASVDLAHMGPIYDHDEGLDEAGEARLEEQDRSVLEYVQAGDAEGFFSAIVQEKNARNVCGVAPVYLTLRLGEGEGQLLRYGQGRIHEESGSVVSFAALAFEK